MPPDIIDLMRKSGFDEKQIAALTITRWKDGIDIQYPTVVLERFVKYVFESEELPTF